MAVAQKVAAAREAAAAKAIQRAATNQAARLQHAGTYRPSLSLNGTVAFAAAAELLDSGKSNFWDSYKSWNSWSLHISINRQM